MLEGEGCFSRHLRKSKNRFEYAIHCEMTDEEPVRKLKSIFNVGTVCYRENNRKDGRVRKPSWIWSVQRKEDINNVIKIILPLMVTPRRIEKCKLIESELIANE